MNLFKHPALVVAPLLVLCTAASAQDITEGTVLAHDRKANILVMSDKSVFPLEKAEGPVPEGLKAGDRVEITYTSNEDDGIVAIHSIQVVAK